MSLSSESGLKLAMNPNCIGDENSISLGVSEYDNSYVFRCANDVGGNFTDCISFILDNGVVIEVDDNTVTFSGLVNDSYTFALQTEDAQGQIDTFRVSVSRCIEPPQCTPKTCSDYGLHTSSQGCGSTSSSKVDGCGGNITCYTSGTTPKTCKTHPCSIKETCTNGTGCKDRTCDSFPTKTCADYGLHTSSQGCGSTRSSQSDGHDSTITCYTSGTTPKTCKTHPCSIKETCTNGTGCNDRTCTCTDPVCGSGSLSGYPNPGPTTGCGSRRMTAKRCDGTTLSCWSGVAGKTCGERKNSCQICSNDNSCTESPRPKVCSDYGHSSSRSGLLCPETVRPGCGLRCYGEGTSCKANVCQVCDSTCGPPRSKTCNEYGYQSSTSGLANPVTVNPGCDLTCYRESTGPTCTNECSSSSNCSKCGASCTTGSDGCKDCTGGRACNSNCQSCDGTSCVTDSCGSGYFSGFPHTSSQGTGSVSKSCAGRTCWSDRKCEDTCTTSSDCSKCGASCTTGSDGCKDCTGGRACNSTCQSCNGTSCVTDSCGSGYFSGFPHTSSQGTGSVSKSCAGRTCWSDIVCMDTCTTSSDCSKCGASCTTGSDGCKDCTGGRACNSTCQSCNGRSCITDGCGEGYFVGYDYNTQQSPDGGSITCAGINKTCYRREACTPPICFGRHHNTEPAGCGSVSIEIKGCGETITCWTDGETCTGCQTCSLIRPPGVEKCVDNNDRCNGACNLCENGTCDNGQTCGQQIGDPQCEKCASTNSCTAPVAKSCSEIDTNYYDICPSGRTCNDVRVCGKVCKAEVACTPLQCPATHPNATSPGCGATSIEVTNNCGERKTCWTGTNCPEITPYCSHNKCVGCISSVQCSGTCNICVKGSCNNGTTCEQKITDSSCQICNNGNSCTERPKNRSIICGSDNMSSYPHRSVQTPDGGSKEECGTTCYKKGACGTLICPSSHPNSEPEPAGCGATSQEVTNDCGERKTCWTDGETCTDCQTCSSKGPSGRCIDDNSRCHGACNLCENGTCNNGQTCGDQINDSNCEKCTSPNSCTNPVAKSCSEIDTNYHDSCPSGSTCNDVRVCGKSCKTTKSRSGGGANPIRHCGDDSDCLNEGERCSEGRCMVPITQREDFAVD